MVPGVAHMKQVLIFDAHVLTLTRISQTALSFDEAYTLATGFITSCPASNPKLPFKAFSTLTLNNAVPGQKVTVQYASTSATPTFVAFFYGLSRTFVPIDTKGQVSVPTDLSGQVYAVATVSGTEATDGTTVAGPAILLFERDSAGKLIN